MPGVADGTTARQKSVTALHEEKASLGGQSFIYPSPVAIDYVLRDPGSHQEYEWSGSVYFSHGQHIVLLGHHRCLEKFDVTFRGPEKALEIVPRFKTESIGRPRGKRV